MSDDLLSFGFIMRPIIMKLGERGIKSLSDGANVLVEIKFICKSKPGLPVEFEHFRS